MAEAIDNERFRKLLISAPGKALEWLRDAYYVSLVEISMQLIQDRGASADIVQETFIYVWENRQKLSRYREQSIQHYLVRVVRNKSISFFKERLRMDKSLRYLKLEADPAVEPSPEAQLIAAEIRSELRNFIATFPKRERECLLMRIDEDMSYSQIAARLNVTVKEVERALTNAHKRLRKRWSGRF